MAINSRLLLDQRRRRRRGCVPVRLAIDCATDAAEKPTLLIMAARCHTKPTRHQCIGFDVIIVAENNIKKVYIKQGPVVQALEVFFFYLDSTCRSYFEQASIFV